MKTEIVAFFSCLMISIFADCMIREAFTQTSETQQDYYKENYLRYKDYVYYENVKTVLFYREGWELSSPLLLSGSDEKLLLCFDDLDGEVKKYMLTFIHCDAYWRPSEIMKSDYMEGFFEEYIDDYEFSFNTIQKFTHYRISVPTNNIRLKIPGNYLLLVYLEGEPETPVITRRFMIFEQLVSIDARIKPATPLDDRNYNQEVDFSITDPSGIITDPYRDLHIVIQQNGRWDNAIRELKPKMVKGNILDFNFDLENNFTGGNEFRYFDIKSFRYQSANVAAYEYNAQGNQIWLLPDQRRPFKVYSYNQDINGKFLIKTEDAENSSTEADYAWVHFFLEYPAFIPEGNIYILGGFNDWGFNQLSVMNYDMKKKGYFSSVYLKQGYYNYQYVFLEDGNKKADETLIEGSHFETENEYTIYVYYRPKGNLYDVLIGLHQLNSLHQN